jgi:hypothetical protein
MGLLVNYSAGPLNVAAGYNTVKVGAYSVASGLTTAGALMTASLAVGQDIAYSFLGGNYKVGANTFYAGMTNVKASNATEDSQSWNLAYKYALNANVDLLANVLSKSTSLTTANQNAKLIGFGADYRLSKRTNLYARYENVDINTDNALTGETIRTSIGVRHQF